MKGKDLCKLWNVKAEHALYRESGDWFHQLKRFPGAFFDKSGYILFNTELDYKSCSGIQIKKDVHVKDGISSLLGYKKFDQIKKFIPADGRLEAITIEQYYEGQSNEVVINKYERNAKARRACLEHFGTICFACKTDYSKIYGQIAKDLIHIHHIIPVSTIRKKYSVNPIKDLVPLCPNCHYIVHKKNPAYTIDEIKEMILNQKIANESSE